MQSSKRAARSMRQAACLSAALLITLVPCAHAQRGDTLYLSIEDAVTRALHQSDETRLAAAQVDVAEAQITAARAVGLPLLRLNGAYTQVLENARGSIVGSAFQQNYTYNANINVSQPVFQGGRIVAGTRAASDVRHAARFDEAEVQAQLSVDVQRAYLQTLLAGQIYEIQRRNVALAADRLTQVQKLEAGGRAARYDVLRARVERANLEPAVVQARSDRDVAELGLKQLLNLRVEQPIRLVSTLDSTQLEAIVRRVSADSVIDQVRASVRSAELTLEARKQGVRIARADLLPTISVFFQTGFLALPTTSALPTVRGETSPLLCPSGSTAGRVCQNNGWFTDRNLGLNIAWPLFDGLRAKGNIDLAHAQERIAAIQLQQKQEFVAIERARARAEFERARGAFEAQQQNSTEAEEAFRLASLRFDRGLGTQLETSDAQVALLTARTNEARAVFDLYIASADLARARGLPVPLPPTRQAPARSTSP
jgi:outer membrane protein TolC